VSTPEDLPVRLLPPMPSESEPSRGGGGRGGGGKPPRVRSRRVSGIPTPDRSRPSLYLFEWACIAVIISIVLTLSLSAYRRSAEAARGTACATNLQRLYQMTALYAQDYDGVYPPLPRAETLERATRPFVDDAEAWTLRLAPYREAKERMEPFTCPSADAPTYAYNAALGGRVLPVYEPGYPPKSDADVATPSATFLFWDTANQGAANALSGHRFFYGGAQQDPFRPGDFVLPTRGVTVDWQYPRHNDGANALYCDGHARRITDPAIHTQKCNPFDPAG
jgi:hypothetical protein